MRLHLQKAGILLPILIIVGCVSAQEAAYTHDAELREIQTEAVTTKRMSDWFEAHRDKPPLLRSFLARMPKGGDLHNHLSGAVYAESYLAWAADDNCLIEDNEAELKLRCGQIDDSGNSNDSASNNNYLRVADVLENQWLYDRLIDQMSTRNLAFAGQSAHDQFFGAFAEFGPVAKLRVDDMIAEVASDAAAQRTYYLELMLTFRSGDVRKLSGTGPLKLADFAATRRELFDSGLEEIVAKGHADLNLMERELRKTMSCGESDEKLGCGVKVRYIAQSTRTKTPREVFGQLLYAVELVKTDPRVVGLNLVAPEDNLVALRDYKLHMDMLDFLTVNAPEVNVSLHAGELTLGLVQPRELGTHIRDAVMLGRAKRIGHGVDIGYDDDAMGLMDEMRNRNVLVEICLTSNDVILGVQGHDHPFQSYLAAGVPLAIATDDPGISRIDLTNEYLRAALTYDLSYTDLKTLARNSLNYSFLPGERLFNEVNSIAVVGACADDALGGSQPTDSCANFLSSSERAQEQWRLEAEFRDFETEYFMTARSPRMSLRLGE